MELEKKIIHKNKTPITAFSQMVTEDDYNLPEYKPDIMTIIKSRGTVSIEEMETEDEHVTLQGKLLFEVLYQGEGKKPVIDCIKGNMPFRERISVEGIMSGDNVSVSTEVEDMGVVVINSRKLSLRGLTEIHITVSGAEETELPIMTEYPEEYQVRKQEKTVLKLMEQKKDRMRMKQEVSLPKEKPNMENVLWQEVHLEQMNMRQIGDGIELSAMMCLFVLYRSKQDEFTWYETTIPVSDRISCEISGAESFYQIRTTSVQNTLEAREDLDGEMRNLVAECFVELSLSVWQEEKVELLQDAYCMTKELHIHRHREEMWQMAMKNEAVLSAEITQKLSGTREALYLCNGQANVRLLEVKPAGGSISVSGQCYVEALYLTTEETSPLACAKFYIPFEGEIEAGGISEGDYVDVEASLHRLQCSLADSSNILCRAEISLQLVAFHKEEMQIADDVIEEPLDMEELQKQAGMIGYVVKGNEDLWDIAKRFHTTKQDLMDTNELSAEELPAGQKLLVMKHICI